ncbi:MAG: DUF6172 family protein [Rubritalea sp.]|uniref:DUF6172 family protein n=1 Tax=Rubritalea sp. TaxID=2109375 RepID=UPI003241F38B
MRKVFSLIDEKKKPARMVEAAKNTINKYIKRERKKTLTEGMDFWDFDCQFGADAEVALPVHFSQLFVAIDQAEKDALESFYVEIIAKEVKRTRKPKEGQ